MKLATFVFLLVLPGIVHADIVQVKSTEKVVAVGTNGTDDGTTIRLTTCSGKKVEYSAAEHKLNTGDSDCRPVVENRLPAQLGISKHDSTWHVSDVRRFSNYFPNPVRGARVQVEAKDASLTLTYRGETVKIEQ